MRIIKAADGEKKRINLQSVKDFFKAHGKRVIAIAGGLLIIGGAVALNLILPSNKPKADVVQSAAENASDDYFAASALNRTKARDEAMEVLQTVVDLGQNEEAAAKALSDISRISADIEKEANIETLIKAKGFEDCIAVISGDTLNVVIKGKELLPNEIAQIKEIAYKGAAVLPDNVVITLKD